MAANWLLGIRDTGYYGRYEAGGGVWGVWGVWGGGVVVMDG